MFVVSRRVRDGIAVYAASGQASVPDRSGLAVFKGDLFGIDTPMLERAIRDKGLEAVLPTLVGEFCGVWLDRESDQVIAFTDKSGRENIFCYECGSELVLSDDFWEVAHEIGASAEDVDPQSVKELTFFYYPLAYKTILKNVSFVPPATIAKFGTDAPADRITYWALRYNPQVDLSLDDAVDELDQQLHCAFRAIRGRCGDVRYGVGLSGGLDSRVIPHYALRNSMSLQSFIIGERRPNRLLLSRDHKSARTLARYFGLHHTEVEWNSEAFARKMYYDIRNFPIGASQFFITLQETIPSFDVLLTGASGIVVGAELPPNVATQSREELVNTLISQFSLLSSQSFWTRASRSINEISHRQLVRPKRQQLNLDGLLTTNECSLVRDGISAYVHSRSDRSAIDIFQEYFFHHIGSRNKSGAFESLQNRQRSFSIYSPFLLDTSLHWKPEFLVNRLILRRLIAKVTPGIAGVRAQDFRVSIAEDAQAGSLSRARAMCEYLARGGGLRHEAWARRQAYIEFSQAILRKRNRLFESLFSLDSVRRTLDVNPRLYERCTKTKMLLDLIDSGQYQALRAGTLPF